MSNASTNVAKRLLHIIQFLLDSNYVSTSDIQDYLTEQGLNVPLRTVQRDMVALEDIIPLEARKDDKPYSWRWQRLENTQSHQLTITQAIALRIVETELKGVIPDGLYESLQPLFMKSQFVTGLSQMPSEDETHDEPIDNGIDEDIGKYLPPRSTIGSKGGRGFMPLSPWQRMMLRLRAFYMAKGDEFGHDNKDEIIGRGNSADVLLSKINHEMRLTNDDKQAINRLADELANQDLGVLVGLLEGNG